MRRPEPVHLSPDEHCAVHHFIRVHGRRPTPDELRRELSKGRGRHRSARAGSRVAALGVLRREFARVLVRL